MNNKTRTIRSGAASVWGTAASPWKKGVLASAAALALLGVSLEAQALALGAVSVKSYLGEPLRAEIEIPEISSEGCRLRPRSLRRRPSRPPAWPTPRR